jgi:threonine/homoserine/homoserine lactone efflux protein
LFLIGFIATIAGAIPPGASNLAVIKTTVQENMRESLKISYGAGIGEVFLALTALSFGMIVQDFILMNNWIQILVLMLLGCIGIYLIKNKKSAEKSSRRLGSKYVTGFFLSVINPPVLVYWVLVFSFLRTTFAFEMDPSATALLVLGIFLGKVVTLYGYSKLGSHLMKKKSGLASRINPLIGSVLVGLSLLQGFKLLFF